MPGGRCTVQGKTWEWMPGRGALWGSCAVWQCKHYCVPLTQCRRQYPVPSAVCWCPSAPTRCPSGRPLFLSCACVCSPVVRVLCCAVLFALCRASCACCSIEVSVVSWLPRARPPLPPLFLPLAPSPIRACVWPFVAFVCPMHVSALLPLGWFLHLIFVCVGFVLPCFFESPPPPPPFHTALFCRGAPLWVASLLHRMPSL